MSRTVRLLVIAVLCVVAAQPWGWAAEQAAAQVIPRDRQQTTQETAPLATFTGSIYGVSIDYPSDWQITGSGSDGGADYLHLDNGTSKVSLVVGPGPQDVLDCADQTALMFKERVPGFEDIQFAGLISDTALEVGVLFEDRRSQMSLVIICQEFGDPEANIVFTWTVSVGQFKAEVVEAEAMLRSIRA